MPDFCRSFHETTNSIGQGPWKIWPQDAFHWKEISAVCNQSIHGWIRGQELEVADYNAMDVQPVAKSRMDVAAVQYICYWNGQTKKRVEKN